jgi:hypothetical protein
MKPSNILARIQIHLKKIFINNFGSRVSSAQDFSNEQFLHLFDLRKVQGLINEGRLPEAQTTLIDHYRSRKFPRWPKPSGIITDLRLNLEKTSPAELIQYADHILDYEFLPAGKAPILDSNGDINWNANPISSPEWLWRLHRHQWWPVLGLAYSQTGREQYAQIFVTQMIDWVKKNPLPMRKDEKSFAWRLMEAGMRMQASWIQAFGLFFKSQTFTEDAKMTMLRSIYDHAQFLSLFKTSQNHLLRESNGLAYVSIYFPEFISAKHWMQLALARLDQELEKQINRDGFHIELSTGYQWVTTDEFEKTFKLLEYSNLSLPNQNLSARLEKMYYVLAYLIRPDGSFPELNDGFIRWPVARLTRAGRYFKRDDFIYIGSKGHLGVTPDQTSMAFQNAGYYVMRSDWSQNAKYLLFDSGPCRGFHGHEDKLSIEVFAFGTPFIVDSGSFTYEKTDPFRAYFVGSHGHNSVLVDGRSQVRRWNESSKRAKKSSRKHAIWISNANFDYAMGSYKGRYGKFALEIPKHPDTIDDVTHTRQILFLKPDYWLILDELIAVQRHNYQLLFHGHPELETEIEKEKKVLIKNKRNRSCLYLIPAEPENVQVELKRGCEAPIQGWYSMDHHFKTPSTAIIYDFAGAESAVIGTLLYPFQEGASHERVRLRPITVSSGKGLAFEIKTSDGTDYLMFSKSDGLKQFHGFQSDGLVAGIRMNRNGEIINQFEASAHDS